MPKAAKRPGLTQALGLMRSTSALIVLGTLVILTSISVASYFNSKNTDAGTLWSAHIGLRGENLRLFHSGRYESLVWGDLPPYAPVKGTWRRQHGLLYLIPDMRNKPIRTFEQIEKFDCTYLRRPGLKVPLDLFPSGITIADLSIEGSGCGDKAREENDLGRAMRH